MVEERPNLHIQTRIPTYVPVYIPQTNTEQTKQKQDKATQTDPAVLCAQNQTPKPTIDFSKYRSRGKPKYAPPKYRCILAGYETDLEEELLIPNTSTQIGVGNCESIIDSIRTVTL